MSPARPHLRKLLNELLRSDSDLEAFCSDYFPDERARFTLGMERSHKLTLLLDHADIEAIADALRQAYPAAAPKVEEALSARPGAVESIDELGEQDADPSRRAAARPGTALPIAGALLVALIVGVGWWKWASRRGQARVVEAVGEPPPGHASASAGPVELASSAVPGDAGEQHAHAAPAPVSPPSALHASPPRSAEVGTGRADCAGEALAEPRCSYRGTLRNESGAPVSGANVELLGTSCVRTTGATGGFDFAGCDPIALARLSNPRVFVRFPGGIACYGTSLLRPPLMTEIKVSGRNRCPDAGVALAPPFEMD